MKNFLKPTWVKIILTIILFIISLYHSDNFPLDALVNECNPYEGYCFEFLEYNMSFLIFNTIFNFILSYLISCLLVWVWKRIKK